MDSERVPVPRLKGEWAGRYVRLLRTTSGGYNNNIFDKGEILKVDRNYKGVHLEGVHECKACNRGYKVSIIVPESYVELMPEDYKPEWSARIILDPARLEALRNTVSGKMSVGDRLLLADILNDAEKKGSKR